MLHATYHTELDSFLHEGGEPLNKKEKEPSYWSRELRFLFCEFTFRLEGPMVNLVDEDLDHLKLCHITQEPLGYENSLSADHNKLYNYLVKVKLKYIRFVPRSKDGVLDYMNSFTLNEWD